MNMNHILKAIEYARDGMFVSKDLTLELIERSGCKKSASILIMFSYEMLPVLWEAGYTNVSLVFDKPRTSIYNIAKKFGNGKVYNLEEIDGMKFDVVIGNPPFSRGEKNDQGYIKQGDNLAKQFLFKSVELARQKVAMIIPYGQRTYSPGVAETLRLSGLHTITDCSSHFNHLSIASRIGVFYIDIGREIEEVEDQCKPQLPLPARPVTENYIVQAGQLSRYEYEDKLKDSGKHRVIVTLNVIKYTNDSKLIDMLADKSRGHWRVVINTTAGVDEGGLGHVMVALPTDTCSGSVNVFVCASKAEAERLKKYLESDTVRKMIPQIKRTAANSKKWLQYIPMPE